MSCGSSPVLTGVFFFANASKYFRASMGSSQFMMSICRQRLTRILYHNSQELNCGNPQIS